MRERAAGILIKEGKILLIHRIKILSGIKDEYFVIPGGGIESYETPSEATIRELKEEIGIDVNILDPNPIYIFENDEGKQNFLLVEHKSGIIGTGKGPEFTSREYSTKGLYSAEMIELSDIISKKINLVPQFVSERIISDILRLPNFSKIFSKDLSELKSE